MKLQATRNGVYIPRVQSIQVDRDSTGTSSATITAIMSGTDAASLSALDTITVLGAQLVTDAGFNVLLPAGAGWKYWTHGGAANWSQYETVGTPVGGSSATFVPQLGVSVPNGSISLSTLSQRIDGVMAGDLVTLLCGFSGFYPSPLPSGVTLQPFLIFRAHYMDGSTHDIGANGFVVPSGTPLTSSGSGTVPLSASKLNYCELIIGGALVNASGSTYTVSGGSSYAVFADGPAVFCGGTVFAGLLHSIQVNDTPGNQRDLSVSLACRDYKALTDAAVFSKNYTAATTDQAMIQDILVQAGLTDISAASADVQSIISLTANYSDNTVTEALDAISKASGAVWLVTPDKRLRYFDPATANVPAPFSLNSDSPNGFSSFKFGGALNWRQDFYTPANHVLFVGGLDGSGNIIRATADNASSKTAYHRTYSSVVRDPTVNTQTAANAAARTYLNQNSNPQQQLSVTCWQPGLLVGQIIGITRAKLGWNNRQFAIRKISIQQTTADQNGRPDYRTAYQLTLGDYAPSLTQVLKGLTGTTSDMQILNQTVTINPIVTVPAYTPIVQDSLMIPFPVGSFTGDQTLPHTLVNITGQAGKLISLSVQLQGGALGDSGAGVGHYYLANGASPAILSVFVQISIDGQPGVLYYPINGQQPAAGSECDWDGGLYAVFGTGYINQNAICAYRSAMAMRFDIAYSNSINVQIGFLLTLPSGTYIGSNTGTPVQIQCTAVRSQQIPS